MKRPKGVGSAQLNDIKTWNWDDQLFGVGRRNSPQITILGRRFL